MNDRIDRRHALGLFGAAGLGVRAACRSGDDEQSRQLDA